MQNGALPNGINGGMTIYYTQQDFNANGNQKITAFKPVSLLARTACTSALFYKPQKTSLNLHYKVTDTNRVSA